MRGDFHLHTTASDGKLSPSDLVALAARNGLQIIAITDHDSTEGLAEAIAAAGPFGLQLIPGIEMSSDLGLNEVHILGLFIEHEDPELQRALAQMRVDREDRGYRMVQNLGALGYALDWERVLAIAAGGAVGRPHVAEAMLERGYVASVQDAFDRFLGRDGPAYAERPKLLTTDAVAFVQRFGGLAVVAHPFDGPQDLETLLADLKPAGLVGLESYYGTYTAEQVQSLVATAGRFDLIPTGGSDFHGFEREVGVAPGTFPYPEKAVERLLQAARERGRFPIAPGSAVR